MHDDESFEGIGERQAREAAESQGHEYHSRQGYSEPDNSSRALPPEEEARHSEVARLDAAIIALGETRESIIADFSSLADNYAETYYKQFRNETPSSPEEKVKEMLFTLQFGVILSLLESDEDLFRNILTSSPEEWGKVNEIHERIKRSRRV